MLKRDTRKLACEIEKIEEHEDNNDVDYGEGEGRSVAGKLIAHLGREVIPRSYRYVGLFYFSWELDFREGWKKTVRLTMSL